uniref:Uncharacterized protein n=1 Tax=Tetranychus urticae TaxID=32264 RepID=T1L636_TETUR
MLNDILFDLFTWFGLLVFFDLFDLARPLARSVYLGSTTTLRCRDRARSGRLNPGFDVLTKGRRPCILGGYPEKYLFEER